MNWGILHLGGQHGFFSIGREKFDWKDNASQAEQRGVGPCAQSSTPGSDCTVAQPHTSLIQLHAAPIPHAWIWPVPFCDPVCRVMLFGLQGSPQVQKHSEEWQLTLPLSNFWTLRKLHGPEDVVPWARSGLQTEG